MEKVLLDRTFQISEIVRLGAVTTWFQPVVSIRKKEVIGFEGLSRGMTSAGLVAPAVLYSSARDSGCLLELDRLCREKTLMNFEGRFHNPCGRQLVFMNFEASLLDEGACGSGHLIDLVSQMELSPSDIVIEIVESRVRDIGALKRFVITYRDYGFLIALDDIGAGHSNLDRISLLKPDILKIDREVLKDIDRSYHKQEIFKSITNMAHNLGAIVVAEGVETEEEVLQCLALGADLFQGYYFGMPDEPENIPGNSVLMGRIAALAARYKNEEITKLRECRQRHILYAGVIKKLLRGISQVPACNCEERLREMISGNPAVEAFYIVDENGIQITDTVINPDSHVKRQKLFHPARRGDDQSMKEYIYPLLSTGLKRYTTDRYISLATGNICRTVAISYRDAERDKYILCVDFREDHRIS